MKDGLFRNRKMMRAQPAKASALLFAPIQALCWCGAHGHFGFALGGPLFCGLHVDRDATGLTYPVLQS